MVGSTLAQLSNNLVYSAIVVYALAMVAHAAEVALGWSAGARVPRRTPARPAALVTVGAAGPAAGAGAGATGGRGPEERLGRIGVSLTVLAFGLHLLAVLARGLSAGRVPWGNMYEFSVTGALVVSGAYLLLLRRAPVRYLGVVVTPAVLLTLGLAVSVLYVESAELVPALKSVWLVVHVSAAVVSAGVFTLGAGLSVLYLLRERTERRGRPVRWAGLPSAERLDRLASRVHAFGFPLWTFAVVAGAIWAENAWGRYWGWDPKETWAFITWVVYAAYLHARTTAGWRGRSAAVLALTGYACLLFNYFGVNLLFAGFHSYAF
jgi:cytochrome c-type biogenesis protein CcsB